MGGEVSVNGGLAAGTNADGRLEVFGIGPTGIPLHNWQTAPNGGWGGWVVVRHEIDYLRPARLADAVIARTWVGTASARDFDRHTEILRASDRKVLARARTVWCPIDPAKGRPTRVGDDVRRRFSVPAGA
jgi:acyl-CoA thioesterase FadM